jgi:hypothetical protein
MVNYLNKPAPTVPEFIFVITLAIIVISLLTYTDIVMHDFYAKPLISECYPENQSDFCVEVRDLHNLENDAQISIGSAYWDVLQTQAIVIGLLLFIFRIGIVFLTKGKINGIGFITAVLWGVTVSLLFLAGFIDYGYYEARGMEIPEKLEWLNESGLFQYTKILGNDPVNVEKGDLYVTMFIGVGIIIFSWSLFMFKWREMKRIVS